MTTPPRKRTFFPTIEIKAPSEPEEAKITRELAIKKAQEIIKESVGKLKTLEKKET